MTTTAQPRIVYSVAEAFAALPYEQQAAMCRIVGTDLGKLQERPLGGEDEATFYEVVSSSATGEVRLWPKWSVVLRAFPDTWPDTGIRWVLDVIQGSPGKSQPIHGLSPASALDLSFAIAEATEKLKRLQEIAGAAS